MSASLVTFRRRRALRKKPEGTRRVYTLLRVSEPDIGQLSLNFRIADKSGTIAIEC